MGLWRRLTENEIELARKIYKDNLDYDKVKIYQRRIWPAFAQSGNRAVAFRNNTSFPGVTYSEDFTESSIPTKRGVFIHEVGHAWQHQNKIFDHRKAWLSLQFNLKNGLEYGKSYTYMLEEGKTLLDYGFEQQMAIVQDYYMLKHEGYAASFKGRRLNDTSDPEALLSLYEDVLDEFLNTPTQDYLARYKEDNKVTVFNRELGTLAAQPALELIPLAQH